MGASYSAFLKGNHVRILENGSVLLPELESALPVLTPHENIIRSWIAQNWNRKQFPGWSDMLTEMIFRCCLPTINFDAYAGWGADINTFRTYFTADLQIPGIGGVISTSYQLLPMTAVIMNRIRKEMNISRGLGSHTIPVRLFNPAELVVIDLVTEE